MNPTLLTVLRYTAIGTSVVSAITGFVVDRHDSKEQDAKLEEMRGIQESIIKEKEE